MLVEKFIKVFGERNTGTRALIRMLGAQEGVTMRPVGAAPAVNLAVNQGLRDRINAAFTGKRRRRYLDAMLDMEHNGICPTLAWKHAAPVWDPAFADARAHVVFCVRDPYSWGLSLSNHPYHMQDQQAGSLLDFVERPWITIARDNLPEVLESPLALWNGKARAYLAFMQQAKTAGVVHDVLKFEDFVAEPAAQVTKVLESFSIPSKNVTAVEVSTKDGVTPSDEIGAYYAQKKWRAALTADVVEAINQRIDWDVAWAFGYDEMLPVDFPVDHPPDITSRNLSRTHSSTWHSGFR